MKMDRHEQEDLRRKLFDAKQAHTDKPSYRRIAEKTGTSEAYVRRLIQPTLSFERPPLERVCEYLGVEL